MALYLVLRHPRNPEQVWSNAWRPDDRLVDAIMTNGEVARLCEEARRSDAYVYVHRCAWSGAGAEITCRARVGRVERVSRDWLVSFDGPEPVGAVPRVQVQQGEDYYRDAAPVQ